MTGICRAFACNVIAKVSDKVRHGICHADTCNCIPAISGGCITGSRNVIGEMLLPLLPRVLT